MSSKTTKEIERKFAVSDSIVQYCERKKLQMKEITLIDTYYDDKEYNLTKKDMWLRERNNMWELKVPAFDKRMKMEDEKGNGLSGIDQYLEIRDEKEIIQRIKQQTYNLNVMITDNSPLSPRLLEEFGGIKPFVRLKSTRKRFLLDLQLPNSLSSSQQSKSRQGFYIDIDQVEYDQQYIPSEKMTNPNDAVYTIGEVELVPPIVSSDVAGCMSFIFSEVGINPSPIRGKLLEYIHKFHPNHYLALQQSGQLQSKGIKN